MTTMRPVSPVLALEWHPLDDVGVLAELRQGADEEDWQERALCAQVDPDAWFPEKGGSTREAKRICQGCDVRAECLEYALANTIRYGIWGGMSERERRKLILSAQHAPTQLELLADARVERDRVIAEMTVAGSSVREIATAVGCALSTVDKARSRMRRAS